MLVFSSDEEFNLGGSGGFAYYWHVLRKEKKDFSKRPSDGSSNMILAVIGYDGKRNMCFVNIKGSEKS